MYAYAGDCGSPDHRFCNHGGGGTAYAQASAYDLAVFAGFDGTLDEWIASLAGPPGPAGHPRWQGEGQPGVIPGSQPGDTYLDRTTGTIYQLG